MKIYLAIFIVPLRRDVFLIVPLRRGCRGRLTP
jgi:hypothetical protein